MNKKRPYCKEVKRASLLVKQIKRQFDQWKVEQPDIDDDFFDDDTIDSYLQYIVGCVHKDDWYVIEDRPEKLKENAKRTL